MTHTITTKELRTHLPKIKRAVDQGEVFVLVYRSRPFAQLVPLRSPKAIDVTTLPFVGMWKKRIGKKSTATFLKELRKEAWGRG